MSIIKELNFFISSENKINIESLEKSFEEILKNAKKSNRGFKAASRRFRVNTIEIEEKFAYLRKVTPKK